MHVDMDAFYASVELRHRPELRGRPVIVGGYPRGVVLSATYEARAFGVRSGMASPQARRLAPRATFVEPDFDRYTAVSKAIGAVFRSITAVVESASIDEAFLDVTGAVAMFGPPAGIGEYVRAVVADEQQITCSVGIGPTKFVAKVASRRPSRTVCVEVAPDGVEEFLHPLPVQAMWGVGASTAEKLHRLGFSTVGDLAHTPRGTLRRAFGPHAGAVLAELAWGRDSRRVVPQVPERSVGSQQTFAADSDRRAGGQAGAAADGRPHGPSDAQAGGARPHGLDLGSIRRLHRDDPLGHHAEPDGCHRGDLRRRPGALLPAPARPRPDSRVGVRVERLVDVHQAYRQPQLTDPEFGWREADHAADGRGPEYGPAAVQRAVLASRR